MKEKVRVNKTYFDYFAKRRAEGKDIFILRGGRRSGKTFAICQELLRLVYVEDAVVNMAAMTSEQGRLGAYSDCKTILDKYPAFGDKFDVMSSPREIRSKHGAGRMFFNSYQDPERAKGVACDYLYINEANNFTKQQYTDLAASVRKGVYIDFNPNIKFWVDDMFTDDDILTTTWKDNTRYLTPLQLQYFEDLKAAAERPDASPLDIRNYNVYYLGKYSELRGNIFVSEDLTFIDREELPTDISSVRVFADPSALVGSDSFACVLSGKSASTGKVYVLDVFSINAGSKEQVTAKLRDWCCSYDGVRVYIETNGIIGQEFFRYAQNSGLPVEGWYSHANKFERICAAYDNLRSKAVFVRSAQLADYMVQVYDFSNKCAHDDNADALASTITLQQYI